MKIIEEVLYKKLVLLLNKMVKINGKDFKIYGMDTSDSIFKRLAEEYNTIPKYLYFPDGIPDITILQQVAVDLEMEDLLGIIKNYAENDIDFNPLFQYIQPKLSQQKLDLLDDVLGPFIAFNTALDMEEYEAGQLLVLQFILNESTYFEVIPIAEDVYKLKDIIIKNLNNAIKKNSQFVKKLEGIYKIVDKTRPIPYTKFELEYVIFELIFKLPNISMIELFNLIKLNPSVPFASLGNFYKILKDFVPFDEWSESSQEGIILKLLQVKDSIGLKKDYTSAVAAISGLVNEEVLVVNLLFQSSGKNISYEDLINILKDVFIITPKLNEISSSETEIKGVFYFPQHDLNNYILQDLILNDPLFSSMMAIDESSKSTKLKDSIYIHFNNAQIGTIKANITKKVAERSDSILKGKDIQEEFKIGTYYIRVRISKADNLESVEKFQELFGKLMTIYDQKSKEIIDFYKKFIPSFGNKTEIKIIEEKRSLKDIEPQVFLPRYPSLCNFPPRIISDEEAIIAQDEGKAVMRYPLSNKEGFEPRNYVCDNPVHPAHIYPSLRYNILKNKELVPYLPCCYEKNQSTITGNLYGNYFRDEDLKKTTDKPQQGIYRNPNRIIGKNLYGELPVNLANMFGLLNNDSRMRFLRKGVSSTNSSFLECVIEGMWEDPTFKREIIEEKGAIKYLLEIRKRLATESYAANCSQEMYDFTTDEIIQEIENPDKYFDPKYFTSLLENYYNCNIFVFSRTSNNADLVLPRHAQFFYKDKSKYKLCIFIYEHLGGKLENSPYPMCELIVRWSESSSSETDYAQSYDSDVCKGVKEQYNKLRRGFSLNQEIPDTIFPIGNILTQDNFKDGKIGELIGQGIDSYGKCRMIYIKFKNGIESTFLLSPIPPFAVPEIKNWSVSLITPEFFIKIAPKLGIVKSVGTNVVLVGNVTVTIPTTKGFVNFPSDILSELSNYNKYKKLSRYITAYLFWLYSRYLYEQKETLSLESMDAFQKKFIQIIPEFEYGIITKNFKLKDSGVMQNGRLIVKSEETLKRLMYVLRIEAIQSNKLIDYHMRSTIENYFEDVNDFQQYQNQVVLQGEQSVQKWIQEKKIKYHLHDKIQSQTTLPYFFKNKLVDGQERVWLAQNTSDIFNAVKIWEIWTEQGYNPGPDPTIDREITLALTLYVYKNSNDIDMYTYGKGPTLNKIKILGYKIEGDSRFTVLLSLDN